jgi:hypothetical protein
MAAPYSESAFERRFNIGMGERFGDVPVSQEPAVQQLKRKPDGFVENGPGTLEEPQQVLIDRLLEMDTSHADFLSRRN